MNSRTVRRDARTHARTQLHVNSAISLDDDAALSIESRGHLPRHESQTAGRTDGRTVVTPDSRRLARPPRDEQRRECRTIRRSSRSPPHARTMQSTQADHRDSDRRHRYNCCSYTAAAAAAAAAATAAAATHLAAADARGEQSSPHPAASLNDVTALRQQQQQQPAWIRLRNNNTCCARRSHNAHHRLRRRRRRDPRDPSPPGRIFQGEAFCVTPSAAFHRGPLVTRRGRV